jgi:ribosome-associated toxin RatA of RatAB toxin-antitoxin module
VPETSEATIRVDAPPAAVMAAIADFAAYPRWVPQLSQAQVLESGPDGRAARVRFVIDSGPIKDDYELAYVWTGDDAVEWSLVRARMQKDQRGSYRLSAAAGGTDVQYRLALEPAARIPGLIKRAVQKAILDAALKGLKRHVESGRG